jgi:hypothetical protein
VQGQTTINQKVAAKIYSKYYFECNILNITWLRRQEQGTAVHGCGDSGWRQQPTAATAGAGNGGRSRGSARADNNQPKSGSNSSRNGAGGGRDGGSRGSGSNNGDGGNGGDNAAAMAAVTAAPTWRRQWQRGQPMWAEVIFCTFLSILLFA